ncbi:hypothetical protein [Planctomyces sp. SH-PL14]|uniref:hypothetical protein n=1 Tax=Planctomyces sp. SH-PL14 TaxID=1632864 RepID=UPI00078E3D93|nr:hypothetical protein [Planctomyces sp. SH-PL14]AMV17422.1 hypothetical protein VT03_05990 [Planctomyces sp. SH-PL14]
MESELLSMLLATKYGTYVIAASSVLGSLVAIASVIVPFTKTPKDDEIVGKLKAFIVRFSIFEPKK